ncbi:hypothetical protein NDU88_000444 [Pleurodeles waltl]|uniref:Uncharacterized protein n=1 Tax=Pleurodeles waltl TaxID=8319 RepID=A0AAV7S867_PLEWA|nr:hypothetical protein NDU88_000444 [Pleurodeles waltl]
MESDGIKTSVEPAEVAPDNKQGRETMSVDEEESQQDIEARDASNTGSEKGGRCTRHMHGETNPEVATEEAPGVSGQQE